MSKHEQNKKALETALGLKFFQGRNADWGATYIMSIKGNEYTGIFICDLEPLTGEEKLVVMSRIYNNINDEYEDTDIIDFDSDVEDVELLIQKLDWI
jgi:hypothetical protein